MSEEGERDIDEQFLLELKVHRKVVEDKLFVLQKNEILNVATLLAISSEEKLRHLEATNEKGEKVKLGEGTIGLLWNYIETHRPHGGPEKKGSKPLKTLVTADVGETVGVADFFQKEFQVKRPRIDSEETREQAVIGFSLELFNDKQAPKTVYIRDCYRTEAHTIHEVMGTKTEKAIKDCKSVFIGGARGVGKSVLGVLMTFEFVALGYIVLYEHKEVKLLLVRDNLRPEQRPALEKVFGKYGYDGSILGKPGVYKFGKSDEDLFRNLIIQDYPIHVQDLGDGSSDAGLPMEGRTRRLLLSSPRDKRLSLLHKWRTFTKFMYMPLWTLEELQAARASCFPHVSNEQVAEHFRKYGGIARHALEHDDEVSNDIFRFQLGVLTTQQIKEVMSVSMYETLPSFAHIGYLIHVKPLDSNFTCVFASTYSYDCILRSFLRTNRFEALMFAEMLKSRPEFAVLYGRCLEETGHAYLGGLLQTEFEIHPLIARSRSPAKVSKINWPSSDDVVLFDYIPHLPRVETGKYYRPLNKTYETIDAFMLMDGYVLNPSKYKRGQIILVLIQVTVSKTHKVNGAKVKEVHAEVFKKWKGVPDAPSSEADLMKQLPRVLVFATRKAPAGVHSYQTLTTAANQTYDAKHVPVLDQYALTLERDYEILWKELGDRMV